MLRTISCGQVRKDHIGSRVELAGWVDRRRDHGNLIFIDLRDREGLVQVVFNPETAPEQHAVAERLRSEWSSRSAASCGRAQRGRRTRSWRPVP